MLTLCTLTRGYELPTATRVLEHITDEVRWKVTFGVQPHDWYDRRLDDLHTKGWMAMVDDDDELLNLRPVLDAIKLYPDKGLIYTQEGTRPKAANHSRLLDAAHHLSAINTRFLNINWLRRYEGAIDLLCRLQAGLAGGAVFINEECYRWTPRPTSFSRDRGFSEKLWRDREVGTRELLKLYPQRLTEPITEA